MYLHARAYVYVFMLRYMCAYVCILLLLLLFILFITKAEKKINKYIIEMQTTGPIAKEKL